MYGKTFRRARLKMGMTQEEIGNIIGKSKQWVSRFEQGGIGLRLDAAILLAKAVGERPNIFLPNEAKKERRDAIAEQRN